MRHDSKLSLLSLLSLLSRHASGSLFLLARNYRYRAFL